MALRWNFSRSVSATDLVEASKDAASQNCLVGGCVFFVSDVISGRLLGHLGLLCLALGANRYVEYFAEVFTRN